MCLLGRGDRSPPWKDAPKFKLFCPYKWEHDSSGVVCKCDFPAKCKMCVCMCVCVCVLAGGSESQGTANHHLSEETWSVFHSDKSC